MKYVYVEYALCDGWGCEGVFPKNIVDKAPRKKFGGKECIVLDINDMIVGAGMGWDSPAVLDEKWLKRACQLMNEK